MELDVEVEFDDSLIPDDEWREQFYQIKNAKQLACHFAFNAVVNGMTSISQLDGFADIDDSDGSIASIEIDPHSVEMEVE